VDVLLHKVKMKKLEKIVKQLLTGRDNLTYDLGRVLWAVSFLVGLGVVVYSVAAQKPFDLTNYGLGVSALLVAGGAALKLKESTEPHNHTDQQGEEIAKSSEH
jgi:hypothetical protein